MQQVVFGVIDPRTREIRHIGQVDAPDMDSLRHYFRQFFVERLGTSETNRYAVWARELRQAGLEPEFVILEQNAGPDGKARWVERLRDAGARLTNMRAGKPADQQPQLALAFDAVAQNAARLAHRLTSRSNSGST